MKEEWLFRGALVPIDAATTAALVAEIKRLIDVVGGLVLQQGPDYERGFIDGMSKQAQSSVDKAVNAMARPAQEPVASEKIHDLQTMLDVLRIKQTVKFDDCSALFGEVARKTGMKPPPFELSGNQWCALVNLAVAKFATPPAAQPPEPRNFCPRCGKRTADLTVIHTCTPPEGGHQ